MNAVASFLDRLHWVPHVLSIELRKLFSYRATFWIRYLIGTVTEISVAYFLWTAVFSTQGGAPIEGFSFHGILFYYVFASLATKVISDPEQGAISNEIYQGGLTRYLLYPLGFVGYRYVSTFSRQLISLGQLTLGLGITVFLWGLPPDQSVTLGSILLGMATCLLSGLLLFLIQSCLELIAFWQDTVWNLIAMMRFIGNLVGGIYVPVAFFPQWGKVAARFTPFPLIFSFPIRCFLGQVGVVEWFTSLAEMSGWLLAISLLLRFIWVRGTKRYSGVGI